MAFRRSVTARAKFVYQQQRVAVPFSHTDRDDGDRENLPRHNPIYKGSEIPDILRRGLPLGAGANVRSFCGSRNLFQDRRFATPAAFAPVYVRNLSTLGDGPAVFEEAAAQVARAGSEVAAAAADSSLPVASVQYLIDSVHTLTGLNWWAAIVVTTICFRTLLLPFTIHHTKCTSKFTLIKPQLQEIQKELKSRDMTPAAVAEGQARKSKLYDKYGVTPLTVCKGILIGGPVFVCFFSAINNMAKKVQSFKEGGVFWFTDLTTPDAIYILPVLTALTFCITVERNRQQGLEGDPAVKIFARTCSVLMIPVIAQLPKAIFCYWITSNLYTVAYESVIKKPEVRQMLGIPDIPPPPPPPPSTNEKSFLEELKEFTTQQLQLRALLPPSQQSLPPPEQSLSPPEQSLSPPPPVQSLSPPPPVQSLSSPPVVEALKVVNPSPAAALSPRIKKVEKEVKRRKKGKKRSSG